jgi:hypothetical protein
MSKRKKIEIVLTEEQIKKLQPLQDIAAENHMEGVIVAQVWPDVGIAVCKWMRPEELVKSVDKLKKNPGGLPIPERWIKRYFERTAK